MKEFLDYIGTWSVFKWVALVLIAGFIGQFGKMMAEAVMVKVRRRNEGKREAKKTDPPAARGDLATNGEALASSAASGEAFDKKKMKALAKARKKEVKKQAG